MDNEILNSLAVVGVPKETVKDGAPTIDLCCDTNEGENELPKMFERETGQKWDI